MEAVLKNSAAKRAKTIDEEIKEIVCLDKYSEGSLVSEYSFDCFFRWPVFHKVSSTQTLRQVL